MSRSAMATRDQVDLPAAPAEVWAALLAELGGGGRWWLPNNTFVPLAGRIDMLGAALRVEVRPKGRDGSGPVLAFTAVTRVAVAEELLAMDFVDGCFRGGWRFELSPLDGGRATRLAVVFEAEAAGWVRALARVVDVGAEHSAGVGLAFEQLAAHLADESPAEVSRGVHSVTLRGGGAIRVVRHAPAEPTAVPIVLLHGWASSADVWEETAAGLARRGSVVLCPELRGHGGSAALPVPEATELLPTLVEDALAVIDSLAGGGPVVLAGHSGGGLVALDAAAARPSVAAGLVLVSTAVRSDPLPGAERALVGGTFLGRVLRTGAGAELVLSRTMGPSRPFPGRRAVADAFAATRPRVRRVFFDASSGIDRRRHLAAVAARGLPIGVLSGLEDRTTSPALVRRTAAAAGLAGPVLLPGRGHALPVEAPHAVQEAVLAVRRAARPAAVPTP
ncbi:MULTISPECIES: alpha/beta fold hydrolase [unclassified Rathayibacter]|uniref:alpha/beta fold hydrolase n=1 Tax=unclassified Rathayibacter TaxID=2609250 RepID=UPI00188B37F6|nr:MULTISPECIES: alpha/beta fold hydrolase [unclassified Rathayibacter]MBF4463163.1 alpha/beta fold hydrolase [Rathayibacter sp. VKM Ac-2879]MBF4504600.1 alpha/beta fold hydrolase [Rathayibacter sp. VKM Ac-2878]